MFEWDALLIWSWIVYLKTQILLLKQFGELAQYDLIWKHDVTRFRMEENRFIGFSGLIEILELPNFGHMTTSIIWFETRYKFLFVTSWTEII